MDPLFFSLVMLAVLGYGVQVPLLTIYVRRFDALTVAIYRNGSLALTMLPALLFVPAETLKNTGAFIWPIIAMCIIGGVAFLLGLTASTYLPVGISQSFRQASNILTAVFLGTIFFAEYLTAVELVFVALLLAAIVALSLSRPNIAHLRKQNVPRGVWLSLLAGAGTTIAFLLFAYIARSLSPIATGYFLELGVGITAAGFALARYALYKKKIFLLSLGDALKVAAISLTTIVATLGFGFAITIGNYALATALLSTSTVISLLGAQVFFGEKITRRQVAIVVFVLLIVMALQLLA